MFFQYLPGILTILADFRPFLTLVNFYKKIGFLAIFVLKTPLMNERNCKINSKWNIAYNNGRFICAFAQIKVRLFNHNLNVKYKR